MMESDEAFARRLQAQELGGYHQVPTAEQAPLVALVSFFPMPTLISNSLF